MKNGVRNLKKFRTSGSTNIEAGKYKNKKKGCLHIRVHNCFDAQLPNKTIYRLFE